MLQYWLCERAAIIEPRRVWRTKPHRQ